MAVTSILLVEDEADLRETLGYSLTRQGYEVEGAETGEEGLRKARASPPDLVVLDLMLPGMKGLDVCRLLKKDPATRNVAVVMLTAMGEESDIIRGFELGADDYVTKPFSPRVLIARLEAVLRRRAENDAETQSNVLEAGGVHIDLERHGVRVAGRDVELTATEFRLLCLLVGRPGRVFTRQQIIGSIHEGFAAVTDRSVDVQVVALRRKLDVAGPRIETVRGVGYRFKD